MKYSHIFIDFDETLFNHAAYIAWADDVLAGLLGKEAGFYKHNIDDFHQQLDDPHLRLFKHDAHSRETTGKGWDYISGELERVRKDHAGDFCYGDAHDFLQWATAQDVDVRILTFGDAEYQHYKINTCPVIRKLGIPVHVVSEPKRDFLAREFGNAKRGVLIDDKHPLRLPKNWDEIWINRSSKLAEPKQLDAKTYQVSSLAQVAQIKNS